MKIIRLRCAAFCLMPFAALAGSQIGGLPGHAGSNTTFTADEQTPPFSDIQAQVTALKSTPSEGKLRGAYSAKHLFDAYFGRRPACPGYRLA